LTPAPIGPSKAENKLFGETYGTEIAAKWQVCKGWRLEGSYSYLNIQVHREASSRDFTSEQMAEKSSPRNQFCIRSLLALPWNIQFDGALRYVDTLPGPQIPSYLTLDLRLAWSPCKNVEVAIVGQNLLDDRHPEFAPTFVGTQRTEVQRSFYGTVVWHF
jgi:iron complex outermembrane receptor protein